ncbi:hypothetical protein SK128_004172 [Halocaridina rubra]|uniref:Uncharacterized protein n=1 Tax=Halocaridina rubra TaxID=373956 RepID=A0AAN8WHA3_HALRR
MFADDANIVKKVKNENNGRELQEDLNNLHEWSEKTGMISMTKSKMEPMRRREDTSFGLFPVNTIRQSHSQDSAINLKEKTCHQFNVLLSSKAQDQAMLSCRC